MVLKIYEIQNKGKGIITTILPENLLLLTLPPVAIGLQDVLDEQQPLTGSTNLVTITGGGALNIYGQGGFGSLLSLNQDSGLLASFPTTTIGICDGFGFALNSLGFFQDKTILKDTVNQKGIENAGDYEGNFTARSLVTKQYADSLVSTTPDATTILKGKVKLAGDLGGTADLPTTPTAIHKTGDESGLTGIKTWTNTGATQVNGIKLINNGTVLSKVLGIDNTSAGFGALINNTSSGHGLYIVNNNTGFGTQIDNTSSGKGLFIVNASTGNSISLDNQAGNGTALVINGGASSTGLLIVGKNNTADTFTLDKLGNITANSFTKTGGTAQQILLANGTVEDVNKQKEIITNYTLTDADNGYTIFVNNSATPITITINTTVTIPNFCVGFIQEGTADVTFVGTGVTLSNPIGLKSKGQEYQTFLERKLATSAYYLLGNTKV